MEFFQVTQHYALPPHPTYTSQGKHTELTLHSSCEKIRVALLLKTDCHTYAAHCKHAAGLSLSRPCALHTIWVPHEYVSYETLHRER